MEVSPLLAGRGGPNTPDTNIIVCLTVMSPPFTGSTCTKNITDASRKENLNMKKKKTHT